LANASTELGDDGPDERNERLSSAQLHTFHKHSKIKKHNNNNKINIFITHVGLVFVSRVDDHRFDRREQQQMKQLLDLLHLRMIPNVKA